MTTPDPLEGSHRKRSDFIRELVQREAVTASEPTDSKHSVPRKIVQFWDDEGHLPNDVRDCIDSWKAAEAQGFERSLFDQTTAGDFIRERFGPRHKAAYDKCYHPAMQSDYFRLCYVFTEGGCYIDADDQYRDTPLQHLVGDRRLKLQPLCYDMATHTMVPPSLFTRPGHYTTDWIFYLNNNPLIASAGHPIVGRALARATTSLEADVTMASLRFSLRPARGLSPNRYSTLRWRGNP